MNASDPYGLRVPPTVSTAALVDLARARFWARLAGIAVLVPLVLVTAAFALIGFLNGRFHEPVPVTLLLLLLFVVAIPAPLAVVTLLYARNLGRVSSGLGPVLTSAFRNLRVLWAVTTLAYLSLLVGVLCAFG
jgi:hypothetical protein